MAVQQPQTTSSYATTTLTNCIIRFTLDLSYAGNITYTQYTKYNNCIFIGNIKNDDPSSYNIPTSCTATNCLSCLCAYKKATDSEDAIYDYNIFDNMVNSTNKYLENGKPIANTIKSIFKTYNGTGDFTFHELYELTDEAKAAYIGSDGTQIGIYGGMGFDLVPSTLQITKCEVSPKATKEGKISVSIEVGIPE